MKTFSIPHFRLAVIALLACLTTRVPAQPSDVPPAPPGMAEYYSALAQFGNGSPGGFHPDLTGPPNPGGGLSGDGGCTNCTMPDYTTGLWLSIALGPDSNSCVVTLHNTTNGLFYILQAATNLLGPWLTSQAFLATNVSPNTNMVAQLIAIENYQSLFFRAVQPTPGQLRWKVQLTDPSTDIQDAFGGGLDAAPSLSPDGQTIYMTTANRTISAIDATTGIVLWTDSIFTPPTNAIVQTAEFTGSAAITTSNIYVGSCDGYVYCLNATNGSTNWHVSMGDATAVYSTPAVDASGRILVAIDETTACRNGDPITGLRCLNPTNGSTEWFFQPQDLHDDPGIPCSYNQGDIDSSVAVAKNGTIYFLAESWRLYSIDASGKLNWCIPVQGDAEPDSSVAIDSFGRVLVGSGSEYIYCVNADGSLEWTFAVGQEMLGDFGRIPCSPTIGPGNALYTGTGPANLEGAANVGCLFSIDSGGDANWVTNVSPGNDFIVSSPTLGETTLYFGATSGEFFALTISNQAVAWSVTNSQPIISSPLICPDGSVVFGAEDGWLYCYWGSSLPAGTNASWPTFHANNQRTGLQPGANTLATNNGAPFVSNGTNDGAGHFSFDLLGTTNGSWTVYTSTNLSNWVVFQTNVTLSGSPATNTITDNSVLGETNRYYQLSNSNGCSRAIGFTRLMIAPGTNLVADQLYQVDDGVLRAFGTDALGMAMNDLNALFALDSWATNTDGSAIFEWNGSGFDGDTNLNNSGPPDWIGGGNMTMTPGMSFIISNGLGVSYPIWFMGLVRNQQIFSLQSGTNYLSATAPIAGNITNITGYIPHNGDVVKLWNTSTSNFVSHPYTSGSWGTNGVPVLGIGEGFVLISTNAYVWTNNWTTMAP